MVSDNPIGEYKLKTVQEKDGTLLIEIAGQPKPCPRPRVTKRGAYYSKGYKAYLKAIAKILKPIPISTITEDVTLILTFARKDSRRVDLDNLDKGLMDALVMARVLDDDSLVKEKHSALILGVKEPYIRAIICPLNNCTKFTQNALFIKGGDTVFGKNKLKKEIAKLLGSICLVHVPEMAYPAKIREVSIEAISPNKKYVKLLFLDNQTLAWYALEDIEILEILEKPKGEKDGKRKRKDNVPEV